MLPGVLLFVLAVVALLAIPVGVSFRLPEPPGRRADVRLHWAFGLLRVRVFPSRAAPSAQPDRTGDARRRPPGARSDNACGGRSPWFALVRQPASRRRILAFIRDIWRAIRKDELRMRVRVGLGDPADTGQLWALLGPLSPLMAGMSRASIAIEPEFLEQTLSLEGSGRVQFVPLRLLYLTAALIVSPAIWRSMKQAKASIA